MQKPEKISWKDTNLALIGSELDRKCKAAAAAGETAWEGIGESPGTHVWRIEKFKVVPWPKDRYGIFFRGDSYIVLYSYTVGSSDALKHDIHIWIGSESTQDEYGTAAYKMVEADDYLGGAPIQHRQVEGYESVEFSKIFEALEYLDGGVESGFNKVEPTPDKPLFFQVKGTKAKTIKMSQVPMSVSSMNEGDSFILYVSKSLVWVWHGKDARNIEKAAAGYWADKMCSHGSVTTLDHGVDDADNKDFWGYLGGLGEVSPGTPDEAEVTDFAPILFRVDGDPTKELVKVGTGTFCKKGKIEACLKKSALDDSDVFLLDAGWEVFIWIGSGADTSEKVAAMGAADRYADMEPRANYLPVTIVKSGKECNEFLSFFA